MEAANPAMVTFAREMREVKQDDLAADLGISQGTLSKIENGQFPITPDVVTKLAAALNYPESFFFQDCKYWNLPVTFYRKRARVPANAIRAVRAKACFLRLQMQILLRSLDIPTLRIPLINPEEWHGDVEAVARELRMQLNLPPGPVDNVTRTLEDAGVVVTRCDFGSNQIDALSICEPDGLPPLILVNPNSSGDRLRFSLCHELGHVILHHHLPTSVDVDTEGQADRFAAEFLMPKADIRGHLSARLNLERFVQLKAHWKVSIQALIRRARSLGRISDRYERTLYSTLSRYGYRKNEPGPIPPEEPGLFRELIEFHLSNLGYSRNELARALHVHPSDFRALHTEKVAELRPVRSVKLADQSTG